MDALADVLKTIHLSSSVYFRSELTAPWGMAIPPSDAAQFHVVRRGRCWLRVAGVPDIDPIQLEVGDVVLLPKGHAHTITDVVDGPARPLAQLVEEHRPPDGCGPLSFGGGGEPVTLLVFRRPLCSYVLHKKTMQSNSHRRSTILPPHKRACSRQSLTRFPSAPSAVRSNNCECMDYMWSWNRRDSWWDI